MSSYASIISNNTPQEYEHVLEGFPDVTRALQLPNVRCLRELIAVHAKLAPKNCSWMALKHYVFNCFIVYRLIVVHASTNCSISICGTNYIYQDLAEVPLSSSN